MARAHRQFLWSTVLVLSLSQPAWAASNCEMAALSYYCTAATIALGKATPDKALSAGLQTRAGDHAKSAARLGFTELRDKYYKRGVASAADGRRLILNEIIATCVEPKERAIKAFISGVGKDCR